MSRTDRIDIDQLMIVTDGGRLIWERELGKIPTKKIPSPLRDDGKIPAFSVFYKDGKYLFKDFGGNQEGGDIVKFLMLKYNLTYRQALENIRDDVQLNPINTQKSVKRPQNRQKLDVGWIDMKFTDRHKKYFEAYQLDETFLNSMDIYALSKFAINGKIIKCPKEWYRVCYFAPDIDEVKILTLGENVPEIEKWRSYNIPDSYLWYLHRYKEGSCEDLFVVKSVKDCAVMSKLSYCCIATQSENATTLIGNKDKIEPICKNAYIVFGSDKQGKKASLDANKVLNWRYFNTKNYLLKDNVNDPASLVEFSSLEILNKEIQKALKKWK